MHAKCVMNVISDQKTEMTPTYKEGAQYEITIGSMNRL